MMFLIKISKISIDIILKTLKSIGIEDNYLKEKVINVFNKCDLVVIKYKIYIFLILKIVYLLLHLILMI